MAYTTEATTILLGIVVPIAVVLYLLWDDEDKWKF